MRKPIPFLIVLLLVMLAWPTNSYAQPRKQKTEQGPEEIDYLKDYLTQEVEVEDPTYMPVFGLGAGVIQYFGDIKNTSQNPLNGSLAYKLNIKAVYLDRKHRFSINIPVTMGNIIANQYSATPGDNRNMKASFTSVGFTFEYSFGLFKTDGVKRLRPFFATGIALAPQMEVKTDYFLEKVEGQKIEYNYWPDGTIRDISADKLLSNGQIIKRDFNYETSVDKKLTGIVPFEAGLDLFLSDRVHFRISSTLNYCLADLDGKIQEAGRRSATVTSSKKNDMYLFTAASLHFDLFSDPKSFTVEKLLGEVDDYDYAFYDDEDNDLILDGADQCPQTPYGVAVDSIGCPLDADADGVGDYRDKEQMSRAGAIVDADGVEVTDERIWANLNSEPMDRSQVEIYLRNASSSRGERKAKVDIPEKFKKLDTDGDNYISFDEVIKSIDSFFDFDSTLSTNDIYELNNFFFEQ